MARRSRRRSGPGKRRACDSSPTLRIRIWCQDVNLLRVGPAGTNPVIVGTLSDSGSDGDEIAGDGRYSGELTIQEAAPTTLTYYINGAIRNQIVRPRWGISWSA